MKEHILAIDDCRECSYASVLCRNFKDGIAALDMMSPWDILLLDHDLGEEQTGHDIVKWLNEHPDKYPNEIEIITANPVGLENIALTIQDSGVMEKVTNNKRHWKKI